MNDVLINLRAKDYFSGTFKKSIAQSKVLAKSINGAGIAGSKTMIAASKNTAKFSNALRTANQESGRVNQSISQLESKLRGMQNLRIKLTSVEGIKSANRDIGQLERRIKRLKEKGTGGFFSKAKSLAGPLLPVAGAALITRAIQQVAQLGLEYDVSRKRFQILMQDTEKGNALFQKLNTFSNKFGLNSGAISKNASTMLSFGVSGDKVIPVMKQLGDITMGNKERMKSLTLAYAQSASAGRLMGQDLLQMIGQGFNPLQEISKKTGLSMLVLKKNMEAGLIPFSMVENAFKSATAEGGKFFNALEQQAATPMGKLNRLVNQLSHGFSVLSSRYLVPAIGFLADVGLKGLEAMRPLVHTMGTLFSVMGNNMEIVYGLTAAFVAFYAVQKIQSLYSFIRGLTLMGTMTKLATTGIWKMTAAMWANPAALIAAGILALGAAVVWAWNRFSGFRSVVIGTWESLKTIGSVIKDSIIESLKAGMSALKGFGNAAGFFFKGEWASAADAAKKALKDLKKAEVVSNAAKNLSKNKAAIDNAYLEGKLKGLSDESKIKLPSFGGMASAITGTGLGSATGGSNLSLAGGTSSTSESVNDTVTGGKRSFNFSLSIGNIFENTTIQNEDTETTAESLMDTVVEEIMKGFNEAGLQARLASQRI